ncbi:Signal transduction histidine kinase [Ornithinimicrobium cerasi]|uniref:histidine kinase n=1 Tax=Ornithinimicrobium cerasi TaxID=2248773 RepID=A0A285VVP2_9MICO|nr:Signal transduction histidine kinase [Ornithinimicrobium cerasi]
MQPVTSRPGTDLRHQLAASWRDLTGGALRADGWRPDIGVVGLLLLWGSLGAAVIGTGGGTFAGLMLLTLLQTVPLLWRRRRPGPVAAAVAVACLLQVLTLDSPLASNIAVPVVVYSAAAFGDHRTSRAVLWTALAGAVVAGVDWSWGWAGAGQLLLSVAFQATFMAAFVAVAWVLGDVVRRRKAVAARLDAQDRALARDQTQRAQLAAQGERASIAREMHDVVAHSLAVVVVQADGGLYAARQALEAPPAIAADRAALARAAATLETIAQTARESLAETRKLVGVLRDEGAGAEYSPLQGLAYLEELSARVRDSGVPVDVVVRGDVDDLPREVDLAAYRVVQESLTNVLKHAGPDAHVDVDVLRTPAVLLVRVTDDGAGPAADADGEGNGVLGMAERVEVLGGTVHAGPRPRGGWEVVASIPTGDGHGIPSRSTPGGDR